MQIYTILQIDFGRQTSKNKPLDGAQFIRAQCLSTAIFLTAYKLLYVLYDYFLQEAVKQVWTKLVHRPSATFLIHLAPSQLDKSSSILRPQVAVASTHQKVTPPPWGVIPPVQGEPPQLTGDHFVPLFAMSMILRV